MSDTVDSSVLEDWLGEEPLPDKLEYLEQQNNHHLEIKNLFDEWFDEMEGYCFRSERFWGDFDYAKNCKNDQIMLKWMQTAFEMGYYASESKIYGGTE